MIKCNIVCKNLIGNNYVGGQVYENIVRVQTKYGNLNILVYSAKQPSGEILVFINDTDILEANRGIFSSIKFNQLVQAIRTAIIEERMYIATK